MATVDVMRQNVQIMKLPRKVSIQERPHTVQSERDVFWKKHP
jgi:hypothetical protein